MKSCESYRLEEVFKVFGNKRNYRFLGPVGYGSYSAFSVYSDPNLYYSKFRNMADVVRSWGQKEPERYGYIKNHKKIVKNGQARTRESEEYKKKPKNQSRSQEVKDRSAKALVTVHHLQDLTTQFKQGANGNQGDTSSMEEAQRGVGFALNSLTQQAPCEPQKIAVGNRCELTSDPTGNNCGVHNVCYDLGCRQSRIVE
ncbi:hypothetical protein Tco_0504635 [Tanacetum coccineum]